MKKALTAAEQAIWDSLQGKGFTTYRQEIVVRHLDNDYNLPPRILKLSGHYTIYAASLREGITRSDYNMAYYSLDDCAEVFGSKARNWRDWARCGLNIQGSGQENMLDYLSIDRHEVTGADLTSKWPRRFISARMVVFYLAAQTKTWATDPASHAQISQVKDLLSKHDIPVLTLPPYDDGLVLDDDVFSPAPPRVTVIEPEPAAEPEPAPEKTTSILDLTEDQYQSMMDDFQKTRSTMPHRREFRAALRDALGGDILPLNTIFHNDGIQPWMCRLAVSIATGKPEHEVDSYERLRARMALSILSENVRPGDTGYVETVKSLSASVLSNRMAERNFLRKIQG